MTLTAWGRNWSIVKQWVSPIFLWLWTRSCNVDQVPKDDGVGRDRGKGRYQVSSGVEDPMVLQDDWTRWAGQDLNGKD